MAVERDTARGGHTQAARSTSRRQPGMRSADACNWIALHHPVRCLPAGRQLGACSCTTGILQPPSSRTSTPHAAVGSTGMPQPPGSVCSQPPFGAVNCAHTSVSPHDLATTGRVTPTEMRDCRRGGWAASQTGQARQEVLHAVVHRRRRHHRRCRRWPLRLQRPWHQAKP